MKIDQIDHVGPSSPPLVEGKQNKSGDSEFQKILDALEAKEARSNPSPSSPTREEGVRGKEPFSPVEVSALLFRNPCGNSRETGLKILERAIGGLEQYQQALANPQTSLREAGRILQSASSEMDELNGFAEGLSPADPFRGMVKEAQILVSVELEKLHRGDYIS